MPSRRVPPEFAILLGAVALAGLGLMAVSLLSELPASGDAMPHGAVAGWLTAFFVLSFAIAILSVLTGIGGGVVFTPLMMAFTPIDSLVIRSTGLVVAMFSGLMAAGVFMRRGVGHLRLCVILTLGQGLGAFVGAHLAVAMAAETGETGEGGIRLALGGVVWAAGAYFLAGAQKREWPDVRRVDPVTRWLRLEHSYREESENRVRRYRVTRILPGLAVLFLAGILGGFFGMGAGWIMTPAQNLIMGVPLKAATANSGIIIGMVDCVAIWPYMLAGGVIPLFALPWLSGQVVGGYLGAMLLVRVRIWTVRLLLIGVMAFTGFTLVADGFHKLGMVPRLPGGASLALFGATMAVTACIILRAARKGERP